MAKQRGINEIRGTIGNITYYALEGRYYVKSKSTLTREKYFNNPRNTKSLKNNEEFTNVTQNASLLRSLLWDLINNHKDSAHTSRMTSLMLEIRLTDYESELGERKIEKGDLGLLKGYHFNRRAPVESIVQVNYVTKIDREAGKGVIDFPGFCPGRELKYPPGCTHFSIISRCVFIDFENKVVSYDEAKTDRILLSVEEVEGFSLGFDIRNFADMHIVMVMGVQFYELINGKMEVSTNKEFNCLSIVDVSKR